MELCTLFTQPDHETMQHDLEIETSLIQLIDFLKHSQTETLFEQGIRDK